MDIAIGRHPSKPGKVDGSMVIDISGERAGGWIDFADITLKGDAIDLIAFAQFGCIPPDGRKEAIGWAKNWLGLSDVDRRAAIKAAPQPAPSERPKDAPSKDEKARRAKGWWLSGKALSGSPAEAYLVARNIDLKLLRRAPGALRFHPRLKYPGGRTLPGMLAAMSGAKGDIRAVHRTFLAPGEARKADVPKPKMMWGDVKGASIRLSKGRSSYSPEEAARRGVRDETQVICEGIEDGLTWAMIYPDHRVTAAGALSLIGGAPLFECCNRFVIVADNDEGDAADTLLAAAAAVKRRAGNRPVSIIKPKIQKDVNELLKAVA